MLFFHLLFGLACIDASPEPSACEACIEEGGTWQPELNECTQNCSIADISCYTDTCPGDCFDACEFCFTSSECMDAVCVWNQEDGLGWCSDS